MKLWQAWWLGGALLATATALLVWATESAHDAGHATLGTLLDVARILSYLVWFQAVWRSSRNVERRVWTQVARALAIAGLAASALLY